MSRNDDTPYADVEHDDETRQDLGGVVALVTGAGAGIGLAIATVLAETHATVLVNDIDAQRAESVRDALVGRGYRAHAVVGDVVDRQKGRDLLSAIVEQHGPVQVLVNNAAAPNELGLLWDMSDGEIDASLSSLEASFNTIRALVPTMIEMGWGRVVNIGSLAGRAPVGQLPVYSAAKGGLHALTRSLAVDLAAHGITVNAVAPGVVDTDRQRARPESVRRARAAEIPMNRAASPREVAELVRFLCSSEASYITGEIIPIDGGLA